MVNKDYQIANGVLCVCFFSCWLLIIITAEIG